MKSSFLASTACFLSLTATPAVFAEDIASWIPGKPIAQLKIKQQSLGTCWSYVFTELVENYAQLHGTPIELSPEYVAFNALAGRLVSDLRQANIQYTVNNVDLDNAVNTIEVGGEIGYAGKVASVVGMVPASLVKTPAIETFVDPMQDPIARAFNEWERSEIENPTFDDNDTNVAANQMYESLFSIFKLRRITRAAKFSQDGKFYSSPLEFMKNYLAFDPAQLKMISYRVEQDPSKLDELIQSIAKKVEQGHAATIDFPIIAETEHEFSQSMIKPDFIFDEDRAANPDWQVIGQHVVMVVNTLKDSKGQVKALVVQNSMGLRGRDRFGRVTSNVKERGYDVITVEYLKKMSWEGRNEIDSWSYAGQP